MAVEQAPITRLQAEQNTNTKRASALGILDTKLTSLQAAATALSAAGLYSKRSATLSSSASTWTASASDSTAVGSYNFNVTQLATASRFNGASNIGRAIAPDGDLTGLTMATLHTANAVTAGTFTVNGKTVTIAASDSFSDVLARIGTATGGDVTATYNSTTDKLELAAAPGKTIILGAANDSSNFLTAMRLSNADGATSLASADSLGAVNKNAALSSSRLTAALDNPNGDGTGSFKINGVSIDYDTDTDSLSTILGRINSSKAGVTATYDSTNDRINITNTSTGDLGFSFEDTTGNLLSALGVTSGTTTLTRGKNAQFTLNDGGTLTSTSNTLTSASTGIDGLSVTANSTGALTVTVAADTATARSKLDEFILKFNDVQDYIDEQTKITSVNGKVTTSTLTSNREVQDWSRKLRQMAFAAFDGDVKRMTDLGIDFTSGTNKLAVTNSTKLTAALKDQSQGVEAFFSTKTTGFSARFDSFLNNTLGSGTITGSLDKQTELLTSANKSIDTQIADINRRLAQQRSVLESAFIAMEQAQSKSNSILAQLSKSFS